jgi:hypothetical protein
VLVGTGRGGGMSLKKTSPKSFDFGTSFFLGDCILFSKKMKLFSKTKTYKLSFTIIKITKNSIF